MRKILWTGLLSLLLSNAYALTTLDGVEGKKHLVKIPAREMTRIAVDGQKLKGFRYKLDELEVDQDKEAGAVYVQPLVAEKQISIFATSASGMTHELILQPVADMPLESVVIREPASRSGKKSGQAIERAGSLELAVKRLVLAMAKGDKPTEFDYEKFDLPLTLWQESKFVLTGRYTGRSLIGETYRLMNISNRVMRVSEQELYKEGVVAVSVDSQVLRPGEETDVFVVRGAPNEQ